MIFHDKFKYLLEASFEISFTFLLFTFPQKFFRQKKDLSGPPKKVGKIGEEILFKPSSKNFWKPLKGFSKFFQKKSPCQKDHMNPSSRRQWKAVDHHFFERTSLWRPDETIEPKAVVSPFKKGLK
jgi:hypothetical protein